jgi:hypothetical protein
MSASVSRDTQNYIDGNGTNLLSESTIGPDLKVLGNEQHDCTGFARLRRRRKHVWHRKELTPMDAHLVEATIKTFLTEIRNRLDKAAGVGRAADACAGAGFHKKGLEVALDIEQLLYEATTLLNASSLINRIARQS